jgi:putative endonuclease
MYYTYVLKCINSKTNKHILYVGSTSDLRKRIDSHKSKNTNTTKKFDKIDLIYYEACLDKTDAIKRELQLKTGFGRGYIKRRLTTYLNKLRD